MHRNTEHVMADTALRTHLRKLKRRRLAIGIASGMAWGLAAGIAFVLVGAWFDLIYDLPPNVRFSLVIVALVLGATVILKMTWSAFRNDDPDRLAQRLDDAASGRGQIRSAVDLMLQTRHDSSLTTSLTQIAIDRAAPLAQGVVPAKVLSIKPVHRAAASLLFVVGAVSLIAICVPSLAATQCTRFLQPYGDHPPYSHILFRVKPGNAIARYGEDLDIRVTTVGPAVDRLELVLKTAGTSNEETLRMFPEGGQTYVTRLTRLTSPVHYFVRAGRARSRCFHVGLLPVPELVNVRFRIMPPTYTNQSIYDGPMPQGGIAGLPGTHVEVFVASNRPLSGGSLTLKSGVQQQQYLMTPAASQRHEVFGSFEIIEPGALKIELVDIDGQTSCENGTTPIIVQPDEQPFVRLLQPPRFSLATPNMTLPVVVSAEDDYGITRLQLFRSLNGSPSLPKDLPTSAVSVPRRHEKLLLPLADYGLQAGDAIQLFARTEDNDPAGAKGVESPVAVVQIVSQADYEELLPSQHATDGLLAEHADATRRTTSRRDRIDKLLKQLTALPPGGDCAKAVREQIEQLIKTMRNEASTMWKQGEVKLPVNLDSALPQALGKSVETRGNSVRSLDVITVPRLAGMTEINGVPDKRVSDLSVFSPAGQLAATGTSHGVAPVIYRRKVGEYFRRIADELGQAETTSRPARYGDDVIHAVASRAKHLVDEPEGVVRVANLIYDGTQTSQCFSDYFLTKAANESAISTDFRFKKVKLGSAELFAFPLVIMTGEGEFRLSKAEREHLRQFVEKGGLLLASAGCSSQAWDRSFRREIAEIFPRRNLRAIGMEHPIFHTIYEIPTLRAKHDKPHPLEVITVGGRVGILYSQAGLNDTAHVADCCCCGGDEITNAVKMNVNILAYALLY